MKTPPRSRGHQTLHIRNIYSSEIVAVVRSVGIYSDTPLKYEIYSEGRNVGSFLSEPVSSRSSKKDYDFRLTNGDFWVDVENGSDEEIEFWYQIQGGWIINEQDIRNRYGDRDYDYHANEVINRYKRQGFPHINLITNKIETEEERLSREERERIERDRRREEQALAKKECSELLNRLEEVTSYEEVDEIDSQITQKLETCLQT